MAGYLSYLDSLIQKSLGSNKYVAAITFRNGLSFLEKKMMVNSLQIAAISFARICEEQVATAYAYLWMKKSDLMEMEKEASQQPLADQTQQPAFAGHNVLFADLGQTKFTLVFV